MSMQNSNGYVIDSDVDDESGEHDDEFYRGIMHFNIVIQANNYDATGIHWAESQARIHACMYVTCLKCAQATQIRDVFIDAGDAAAGIFGENGSGGFIGDLVVTGGRIGIR